MTVYLHSLGCDKNLVDSEIMLGLLYEAQYKSADDPSQADVIIVNTCGFIQEAVEEGINTVLDLSVHKTEGRCKALIVTGCMAQRYKDEITAEIPEVDAILGVNDFTGIVNVLSKNELMEPLDVLDDSLYEKRANTMPMHVAYIKISEGCDNRCTYCTIPSIRGAYRDRPFESIVTECKRLAKGGARELVLVAQDTAKYGIAMYGRQRLHELVKAIAAIEDLAWVRIMYAYPEHVYPELIDAIAGDEKICSYLDMPIQHSHDGVITRMGRKSTSEGLRTLISQLQEKGIALRTTLIAGFPGETEAEFAHLHSFVAEVGFNHLGVFAYSQEEGTPAAVMKPQIKEAVKKARQETLMALQADIAERNGQSLIGQTLKVMVDGSVGEDEEKSQIAYSGRSQRDAYDVDGAVFFSSPVEWMSGDIVEIEITGAKGYDLFGELVNIIEN
ncbi:MAG: 30S ribosomal protein S12 methylthiotransferase RimO [Defluviitaleaceae bacterium]|nr:30S ribosomal protein S12 methylthiotransferase RimO [Defluviitaleaceae bacterium]